MKKKQFILWQLILLMIMKNLSKTQKKLSGARHQWVWQEIEKHRQLSGKIQGLPIKFKFLTTDSICTTKTKNVFKVKGLRKESMKKDLRV